ncbi:MAG: hypothetical protein ABR613_05940 [Actinomycetota bacterium]
MTDPGRAPVELSLRHDPLRRRHERSAGGFKTVRLNPAGWSALVGCGLLGGGIVSLVSGTAPILALPAGVVVTWTGLLVADHVRWRNAIVHMGFGNLDAKSGRAVVAELARRGVRARYEETMSFDTSGEMQRNVVCRNADAETARRVADEVLSARSHP